MKRSLSASGYGVPNVFSLVAGLAAYREGSSWLEELLGYLRSNRRFLAEFLAERLPAVGLSSTEGSYLAWLDMRAILEEVGEGGGEGELVRELEEEGRVRLSPGSDFGAEGAGFLRLNFACPRSLLEEGLDRMASTIGGRLGRGS